LELIEKLKGSKPRCIKEFETCEPEKRLQDKFHLTEEFTSRKIICGCGNDKLTVEAYKTTETKGFFKKTTEDSFWAPASILCPACNKNSLLFDPRKHGWDGEQGDCCSIVEEGELVQVNSSPDSVYVSFSYQSPENYEEFESEGVTNPEDYFDMFALYVGDNDNIIFEYECA
jgi:hypothetical protein